MKPVDDRSRKALVRKRDKGICICCSERVSAKESDVYELDLSNGKLDRYQLVCDKCVRSLRQVNIEDDDIPDFIAKLLINHFLRQTGRLKHG